MSVQRAYELFAGTVQAFQNRPILSYDDRANQLFDGWRSAKVRMATHDLRIAAICIANGGTLVSRNRRDFDRVPGLAVEYWQ